MEILSYDNDLLKHAVPQVYDTPEKPPGSELQARGFSPIVQYLNCPHMCVKISIM